VFGLGVVVVEVFGVVVEELVFETVPV